MLALRCRQWSRCRLAYIVMQWCSDVHHAWQCPRIAVRQSRGLPRDPTRHDRHGSGRLSVKRQLGVAMDGSEIQRSQNETYEKRVKRKTSANQSTPGSFLWLFAMLLMEVSTTNTIAQLNFAANRKAMLQTTGLLRKNLSVWNISSLLPQGLCLCWHCMLAFQQQGCDKKSPDQMVQERFSTGPHFFFYLASPVFGSLKHAKQNANYSKGARCVRKKHYFNVMVDCTVLLNPPKMTEKQSSERKF